MARPPPARIKESLAYDPVTGKFAWKGDSDGAGHVNAAIGYVQVGFEGRLYYGHSLAWWWVHGVMPKKMDHRNRDRSDNRIDNLRPCTDQQNVTNRPVRRDSASGYKGVRQRAGRRPQAYISVDGNWQYLGSFESPEEAAMAYDRAARRNFGEFASTNFGAPQ